MRTKSGTVDEYLAALDAGKRKALQELRKAIRAVAPNAEECISYGMPAFRYEGRMLVWLGAGTNHCAFYTGGIVMHYKDELKGYKTGKGTIQFQPDHPLPAVLVAKIVKARIAENKKWAAKGKR